MGESIAPTGCFGMQSDRIKWHLCRKPSYCLPHFRLSESLELSRGPGALSLLREHEPVEKQRYRQTNLY